MERLVKGYSRSQLVNGVEEWVVGRNAIRNREIIIKKLVDGVSYMALAEEYDLSLRRVKTIVRKGIEAIIGHL